MIYLSPTALQEIKRLKARQPQAHPYLHLAIKPGGCADHSYALSFEPNKDVQDLVFDCGGIQVTVDTQSINHVDGITIDYSEDLMGGGFRFLNPKAVHTCGCGNSFSTQINATLSPQDCTN